MNISVIIPTLNEAACIEAAIRAAQGAFEVIVVDAGSSDETAQITKRYGARLLHPPPGRGGQMDAGPDEATGDVFLFLHADSRLPLNWRPSVISALSDGRTVAGAFTLCIDSQRPSLRLIERLSGVRGRALGLVYGDQALFVKKTEFFKVGGFRKLPLMEDVDCVKRLRSVGGFSILKDRITVSPRRWERNGAMKTTLLNILIISMYLIGVAPATLYAIYYNGRVDSRYPHNKSDKGDNESASIQSQKESATKYTRHRS